MVSSIDPTQKVRLRPSEWALQALFLEEGQRITYEGRAWVREMIDVRAPTVVWLTSRQIGKTVNSLSLHAYYMANVANYGVIYVVPEADQAYKYSHDRVGPMFKHSPLLAHLHTGLDSVTEKSFGNGSRLYMKWAKHNVDSARGISGHFLHIDEGQGVDLPMAVPVLQQITFQATHHRYMLVSGTPLSFDNPISSDYWDESDQREWMVRCRNHSPVMYHELGPEHIGKHGPSCTRCGKLLDVDDGLWVARVPSNPALPLAERRMPGFHIHQMHCKVSHATPERWAQWKAELNRTPESKAVNEIFGWPSKTSENPITKALMMSLCDESRPMSFGPSGEHYAAARFAGIDWGHGEAATTLCIGQLYRGKFRILYMQKWEGSNTDSTICVPEIAAVLKRWSVARVHADWGGGFSLNKELARLVGSEMLTTNYWSDGAKQGDGAWTVKRDEPPMLTLNKTRVLDELIHAMKTGELSFFRSEDLMPFLEFFTNVRKETKSDGNQRYIKKKNDDMFHSLAYAWLICGVVNQGGPLD